MKRILFFFLFISNTVLAQNNVATTYGNHNDLNSSKYQPSELNLGNKHGQIGFNYYLWMGNTSFDYKTVNDIYQTGKINNQDIDQMIGKLKKVNVFGVGQDYQVLGLALQFKSKSDHKINFGISVVDKFGVNFRYSDNFMKLALKGNKQFAGQKVSLGPLALNAQYRREYAALTAFDIAGSDDGFGVRIGARLKYLQGIASLYMPSGNADMTTHAEGRYIDMDFDYKVDMAGFKNFSLLNFNGSGAGLDAGVTLFLSKNIELMASILDLGAIRYTQGTRSYHKAGNARYEGLVVDRLFGNNTFNGDSLATVFNPETSEGVSYTMPLDTKICIEAEIKTTKTDSRDREYVSNAFFFTYIQGLNNMPGATTRPFFSIGYNHDFHKLLDAGVMASAGGYNKYTFGAFFALKFGEVVKLGFSSDNLMAFVVPEYGTGIDFSTNFSITF